MYSMIYVSIAFYNVLSNSQNILYLLLYIYSYNVFPIKIHYYLNSIRIKL